jgi:hypothetical protein
VAVIRVAQPLRPLWLRQVGCTTLFEVVRAWGAVVLADGYNHEISVEAGYVFDRASFPRVAVPLAAALGLTRDRLGSIGTLAHDACCDTHGFRRLSPHGAATCTPARLWSRREADDLLYALCLADGAHDHDARLAHDACSLVKDNW